MARAAKMALLSTLLFCAGCMEKTHVPFPGGVSSFDVAVNGVFVAGSSPRVPVPVVSTCAKTYGGQGSVPDAVRGTPDCRFVIARGDVDIDFTVKALNPQGQQLSFDGPLSFRAVPGDLTQDYAFRWGQMHAGLLTTTVRAGHMYDEVKIWVEDAPPQPVYLDGGLVTEGVPDEGSLKRTFATGITSSLYFEEPTLAKVQITDGFDNRSSPFVGQFLAIGRRPESGGVLRQSCNDPNADGTPQSVDGAPATMVVTGTDPSGFFVTDLTACQVKETLADDTGTVQVRVPEPDGFLPGTYGSMFIYNYSFPDGLDQGDLIWTLSGSIQEFTSTTQLTFPAWSIREHVRELPPSEWDKNLKLVQIPDLNQRICGSDNKAVPFLTDELCGHNKRNLKMESLESALVRARNVRFPDTFPNCDQNADGVVPFFCEGKLADGTWLWQDCDFTSDVPGPDAAELQCNIDCVSGSGAFAGKRCSERSTLDAFGQYVVTMNPPGPASAGLDASLPLRLTQMALPASSTVNPTAYPPGEELVVTCDGPARVAFGGAATVATETSALVAAKKPLYHLLAAGETNVAAVAEGAAISGAKCTVGWNAPTRINLITRDAAPELNPDCDEAATDAVAALHCAQIHRATYDVVGHLRHLQPGRPRWAILPRDADDICCHPGDGFVCPKPIKACPDTP